MNEQIIKRLKSLGWRALGMIVAFLLMGFSEEILPLLLIPGEVKIVIGLIIGEVTKYLNK